MAEIDPLERTGPFGSTGLRQNCKVGKVYFQGTPRFFCLSFPYSRALDFFP